MKIIVSIWKPSCEGMGLPVAPFFYRKTDGNASRNRDRRNRDTGVLFAVAVRANLHRFCAIKVSIMAEGDNVA
jgi:hypothetical protein